MLRMPLLFLLLLAPFHIVSGAEVKPFPGVVSKWQGFARRMINSREKRMIRHPHVAFG